MSVPIARRSILVGGLTAALLAAGRRVGLGASKATIAVHKSPT